MTTTTGTLVLRCDECDEPVTGRSGYVCVDTAAAAECESQTDEWNRRNRGEVVIPTGM